MRSLLLLAALAAVLASCQAIDPRVCTMPHPPNHPNWARIFNITSGRIDDKYAESVIMRSLAKITGQLKGKKVIGKLCRIASWEAVEACFNPNKKNDKAWPTAGNYGLRAYVTYKCKGAKGKIVKKGFEVWPSPDVVVAKQKGKKVQKITKFPWDYMPYPGGHQIITGSN